MHCLVCELPLDGKPFGPIPICLACRKFYYRCRLKQKSTILRSHGAEKYELRCLTGTNDCVINCTGDWHVTCPKCRFEKCIFMGIEQHCRNFKPPTERNKSLMPVSATRETQLVQKVIDASDVFLEELSQTPLMVRSYRFENTTQAWSTAMYNFEQSSTAISKLLKSMPGFQSLDMAQRCSLFGKFFSNCFTAASSRVISGAWIGSPENGEQLLRFVPEMTSVASISQQIGTVMTHWAPSRRDFALLLADLFYRKAGMEVKFNAEDGADVLKELVERAVSDDRRTRHHVNALRQMMADTQAIHGDAVMRVRANHAYLFAQPVASRMFEEFDAASRQHSAPKEN